MSSVAVLYKCVVMRELGYIWRRLHSRSEAYFKQGSGHTWSEATTNNAKLRLVAFGVSPHTGRHRRFSVG